MNGVTLPSGVTTVDGNIRKLIGGSSLAVGTYTITAKAINYNGVDTQDIDLVVGTPPYSNTKSVKFLNSDYLGANAALMDATLGRTETGLDLETPGLLLFGLRLGPILRVRPFSITGQVT